MAPVPFAHAHFFASEDMIEHVEQGHLWTEGIINVVPSSMLSVRILANNIVVSVFAFCAGIFLGLGHVVFDRA